MSFIISSIFAGTIGLLILLTKKYHESFTADSSQGVQKFHKDLTPRIGGLVLIAGLIGGLIYELSFGTLDFVLPIGLAISLFPVFFMGIIEDFTKVIHANTRFVTAIISGVSFYVFLNVGITQTGLFWLDTHVLSIPLVSLVLTTVIIAGVSNATNIIDGFNGLLLGFSLMATAGIAWVSYQVGDSQILAMAGILMGSIFGLIIFNFPKGKIFTGDGGAYLIGFLLSALSILLVNRNHEVSPWFPMLLLLYPMTETIFSIFRRVIIDNASPFDADGKHLHTLVYLSISQKEETFINHNAKTSLLIWPLMLCTIIPSLVFWENTSLLMITNGLFILGYYGVYKRLSDISEELSYN
jgi:UDP-N-acetylmuramyl pentapeptide phosphotransferase/UDP-N-acetylglucosamine-1-phosphate transferase